MPIILALDTSTEACSVALLKQTAITEKFVLGKHQHTELLLPMLDDLLNEQGINLKQIDAIAFGRGPGSFTGLRIAASVAQAIAFAHDIPLIPISTLAAIAERVYIEQQARQIFAAIDARINEIYWGTYQADENGYLKLLDIETVTAPEQINFSHTGTWVGAGSGWDAYHTNLQNQLGAALNQWFPHYFPHAENIAHLALPVFLEKKWLTPEQALPIYLRDNVVK